MNARNILHVLHVGLCLLMERSLPLRRFQTLDVLADDGLVTHLNEWIAGQVSLTKLILVAFNSTFGCNPLSLRRIAKLLSRNAPVEVPKAGRVLHETDDAVTDAVACQIDHAARHSDDREAVEAVFVRTRQDVEARN